MFNLLDCYESRTLLTDKVLFPDKPWGTTGSVQTYWPVLALEVPGAEPGDLVDAEAACTVVALQNGAPWVDFRNGKKVGAMCRALLRCLTGPPAQDGTLAGERLWLGSGENIGPERKYYQPRRRCVFKVERAPLFVALYIAVSSAGQRKGNYADVAGTSDYALIQAMHYRGAAP